MRLRSGARFQPEPCPDSSGTLSALRRNRCPFSAGLRINADDSAEVVLRNSVRSAVLALTPPGFESLCKRLLTELGLAQLQTVGKAGDRGIDIDGHLRVSPVVSFRVGVQCKRYVEGNKIVPHQIRELQGALGSFDRGIFVTTSVFTQQAEEQASLPGYKPIDLIDGERLIDLLIEHNVGTKQVTLVDDEFLPRSTRRLKHDCS